MSDVPEKFITMARGLARAVEDCLTSRNTVSVLGEDRIARALMAAAREAEEAATKRADAILLAFNDACGFCIECGDVEFLELWVEGDFGSIEEQWPEFDMTSTRVSGADGKTAILKGEARPRAERRISAACFRQPQRAGGASGSLSRADSQHAAQRGSRHVGNLAYQRRARHKITPWQ